MKTDRFWTVLGLVLAMSCGLHAADTAIVKRDKVNLRGKASLKGEVITQLAKGETVLILEEVVTPNPKKGEPGRWAKIQLPENSTVWVFAPYITAEPKTVNVSRVNLRGGRGENFSILGRLDRGTPVREIRTVDNWMEIEAPTNAYAFVAMEYLEKTGAAVPAPTPGPTQIATAAPPPAPAAQPPTTVKVQSEPPPAATLDDSKPKARPEPVISPPVVATTPEPVETAASTVPQVEPPAPTEPAPKRIVIREGRVVYSRSIQAPTTFALESQETHRLINYLHTEQEGLNLKAFAGRKVMVTGEELLDARWSFTPILEVQDVRIAR